MDEKLIICEHCGSEYTHQTKTTIYEREEDAEFGKKYTINNMGFRCFNKSKLKHNPSLRRQGITIDLFCECCHNITKLNIVQHKGQTLIYTTK
jgi:hypothetical protein